MGHINRTCGVVHANYWYHAHKFWLSVEKDAYLVWEGLDEINDLGLIIETLLKDSPTEGAYQKDGSANSLYFLIERRCIPQGGANNTPDTGDEK